MFGFGRGFGRWFGGWWGGRGFGWGARLGYCPWTGLPRGWRWWGWYGVYPYSLYPYSYGTTYAPTYPFTPYYAGTPYYSAGTENVDSLKAQATALQEEIRRIEERIKQLEGQGR
jgi:hypothetical protein